MKNIEYAQCKLCPLADEKFGVVRGVGNITTAKVVVVMDFPTQHDAAVSSPMSGEVGTLVRALLEQSGFEPVKHVYYTYAALCWPRRMKDEVAQGAVAACRERLRHELQCFNDDVLVLALGSWAQRVLGIEERDHWEAEALTGKSTIATIHPSEVMMTPTKMVYLEQSIKKLALKPWSSVSGINSLADPIISPEDMHYDLDPYPFPEINENYGRICLDIETNSTEWYLPESKIFLVGMATQSGEAWIFTEKSLLQPEFHAWIRSFVAHHSRQIGGHNYKFDVLFLSKQFGTPLSVGWDTIAMVNVFNEHWYKDLKSLATYYFDTDDYGERLVHSWLKANLKSKERTFDKVPKDRIIPYLMCDIWYNLWLSWTLEDQLNFEGQWQRPYLLQELPQVNMLTRLERVGFPVDTDRVDLEQNKFQQDIDALFLAVQDLSDGEINNPSSTKQVMDHLYGTLGLEVLERTAKGQPSVGAAAIRDYDNLPVVQALNSFRRVRKLKSSYLDNVKRFIVVDKFGVPRVHPTMKHWKVVTHRLSVENPPLQTLPHKDEAKDTVSDAVIDAVHRHLPGYVFEGSYGERIKGCYVASPGNILVAADGEGWEVSCAVAQSRDPFLTQQIREGNNVHSAICDRLFGEGWTKAQRVLEKNVFFGWMYGGTVQALVRETGIERYLVEEVVEFLEANIVGIKKWREELIAQAHRGKIVLPYYNYHYHFDLITDRVTKDLPKVAVNYPNQGLGSMLISRAAILAQPTLAKYRANVIMLVHDQYLVESPIEYVKEVALTVRSSIGQAGSEFSDHIPWRADVEVGPRWNELKEFNYG